MSAERPLVTMQRMLEKWGVLVAFALLFVASTMKQGTDFVSAENFRTMLNSNAAVGVLAVGMTLVIVSAGIDLSVGSMVVLSAAIGTTAMNALIGAEWSEGSAVLLGAAVTLGAGLVAGCVNGSLVVFGRIAPTPARSDRRARRSSRSSGAAASRSAGRRRRRTARPPTEAC
jgi:ribose transport system permease protein